MSPAPRRFPAPRRPGAAARPAGRRLALGVALALPLAALTPARADLSEKSPFLPKGYGREEAEAPAPAPPQTEGPLAQQLEFRGVMTLGGVTQFSFFDKKAQESHWVRENESVDGISARDFDPDSMTVMVSMGGRTERLSLVSATDAPMPVATGAAAGAARQPPIPPSAQSDDSDVRRRRTVIPRRRVVLPNK